MGETIDRVANMELRGGLSQQQVEELKHISQLYPYFVLPRLALLAQALQENSDTFEQELRESVLYAYDRKTVLLQLNAIESRWLQHSHTTPTETIPKEAKEDATQSLIESFLHNYEDRNPIQGNSGIIYAPAVDYTTTLTKQEDAPISEADKEGIAILDSYIERASSDTFMQQPSKEEKAEKITTPQVESKEDILSLLATDDTFLTESLAKIYIKQRRYSKALEIIKKLSLKYPEKNVYFADQIRFLEKLITNIKFK